MMIKIIVPLFTLILFVGLQSCGDNSSNDGGLPADLTLFATTNTELIQIDLIGNPENIQVTNVTQELNIDNDFARLTLLENELFYWSVRNEGDGVANSIVWEKDYINNITNRIEVAVPLAEGEFGTFAINSEGFIVTVILDEMPGVNNISLQICDKATAACQSLFIGDGFVSIRNTAYVIDDILFFYYEAIDRTRHLVRVNLEDKIIESQLDFVRNTTLSIDDDELYTFNSDTYEVYSLEDFSLIRSGENQFIFGNRPIMDLYVASEDVVHYNASFPQPSIIALWPALLDLKTNAVIRGSAISTSNALNNLSEIDPTLTLFTQGVKVKGEIVVYPFTSAVSSVEKQGIVYTNWNGDILELVELDFMPQNIFFR